jgi:hypothetical protein
MFRRAGGAAEGHNSLYPVRMQRSPVVGLLRSHRPAVDQGQGIHPKHLPQQRFLGADVVPVGKPESVLGQPYSGIVAGGTGQPIAQHIGDHNEPATRIQNPVGANQPVNITMLGTVGGGVKDYIAAIARQFPIGLVNQPRRWQHRPALQFKLFQNEGLGIAHGVEPKAAMMSRLTRLYPRATWLRWGARMLWAAGRAWKGMEG